ncbi:MAG: TlpA family protein disulfide reductase [Candidatus Sumerlaeaceae bacterium]|nr:TlpA family protein disulfide reductase [Candidatus Sumerlaeaceae bacterium]
MPARFRYPLLLAVIAVLIAACSMDEAPSDWNVKVGDALPAFSLTDITGKPVTSQSFEKKVLVISRFATWCPPCVQELPRLEEDIWKKMQDRGVAVVAISSGENKEDVEKLVKKLNLSFPVLLDPESKYAEILGGDTIPRTLVVDGNQKISKLVNGYTPEEFEKLLKAVSNLTVKN